MTKSQKAAASIINTITQSLHPFGLDLVHGFNAAQYNNVMHEHPSVPPLPLFDRPGAFALLVGNTKALWQPFLDDCHKNPAFEAIENPVDSYVEKAITQTLCEIQIPHHVRFSHHEGEGFVSLLHAAEASGFARISPAHIAIHPTHGLWFGMRAVITFDLDTVHEKQHANAYPCVQCNAPCRSVMEKLLLEKNNNWDDCSWQERAAIRYACPVGEQSRYSDAQNYYHYSKDRTVLSPPEESIV